MLTTTAEAMVTDGQSGAILVNASENGRIRDSYSYSEDVATSSALESAARNFKFGAEC